MQDLFLPNNLELHKDGSVTPRDFTKDFHQPNEGESFTAYAKELGRFLSNLKDYERDMYIPIEQEKMLYRVDFNYSFVKPTQEEVDTNNNHSATFTAKYFLELKDAKKFAENFIKQKSVACYYAGDKRARKYHYYIIHENFVVYEGIAVRGEIINE